MEMGRDFARRLGLHRHQPTVGTARRKRFVPAHFVRPLQIEATSETGHSLVDNFGQLHGQPRHDGYLLHHGHLLCFPFSSIQTNPKGTSYPSRG